MNLAITNLIPTAANAAPAPAAVAPSDVPSAAPVQGATPAFAQWLDELSGPADELAGPADDAGQGNAAGASGAAPAPAAASSTPDEQDAQPAMPDPAIAAMALPLMAAAVTVPLPLPLPSAGGTLQLVARGTATQAGPAPVAVGATAGTASPLNAAAVVELPAAALGVPAPLATAAAPQSMAQLGAAAGADTQDRFSDAGAAPAPGQATPRFAAPAGASGERASTDQAAPSVNPATGVAASGWSIATPAASLGTAPATVALAGQPAAWRQTLQEALGDRLRMQVGNNIEQAVIRLEPPDLGRIDIAIRHSAGTLEVALSATHAEVVRQLHSVTDNLRNDLAGRQYAEVTVSVSQAPRAQQAGPSAFADQQGRQRQGGREQDDAAPGLALADAGTSTSTFSLNGRE